MWIMYAHKGNNNWNHYLKGNINFSRNYFSVMRIGDYDVGTHQLIYHCVYSANCFFIKPGK